MTSLPRNSMQEQAISPIKPAQWKKKKTFWKRDCLSVLYLFKCWASSKEAAHNIKKSLWYDLDGFEPPTSLTITPSSGWTSLHHCYQCLSFSNSTINSYLFCHRILVCVGRELSRFNLRGDNCQEVLEHLSIWRDETQQRHIKVTPIRSVEFRNHSVEPMCKRLSKTTFQGWQDTTQNISDSDSSNTSTELFHENKIQSVQIIKFISRPILMLFGLWAVKSYAINNTCPTHRKHYILLLASH